MRNRRALLLFVLGTIVFSSAPQRAGAETTSVDIAGTPVALPTPSGHCLLDRMRHPDQALIAIMENAIRGQNVLLLYSADCGQLNVWRRQPSNYLSNIAQFLAPEAGRTKVLSMARPVYVQKMAEVMGHQEVWNRGMSEVKRRLEEAYSAIQINEIKNLGVLEVTDCAVFVGLLQRLLADDGVTERLIAGVVAMTLVKGKIVNVNLYAPFEGSHTIEALLAEQRVIIERLIAAN